ncbi:uncharacterized protein LOC144454017 isoform X1 [Glandiceps talaboti]
MSFSALATNMNGDISHDNHGNGDVTQSSHGDADSVDKELDWLIDKTDDSKNGDELKLDSNVIADGDFIPRTASPEPGDHSDLPPRASSPQNGEVGEDPYSRSPSRLDADEDEQENDDYELTDEQREAELLLQKMREEGSFPTEDPPEYDVTERIKQLNEELAREGEIEEKKDRKVGFKEVIEEVHPDSDDEGEGQKDEQNENETENDNKEKMKDLTIDDDNESKEQGKQSHDHKDEEGIVIERNGKFEVVKVSDLSPEERAAHGLEPASSNSSSSSLSSNTSSSGSMQPAPPSHPRPATATGSSGSRRKIVNSSGSQRASSAGTQRQTNNSYNEEDNDDVFDSSNYQGHSRYGLTPEQIEYKKEHSRIMAQKRKEEEEKEKEKQQQKREEAESAFQAWLEKKRESEEDRRKEERERRKREKENQEERDANGAYKSWLKTKKCQKKKEKQEQKQREEEQNNGYALRERGECERAYKDQELSNSNGSLSSGSSRPLDHNEWLKKKSSQLKAQKQMSRSQNLRRKLEARKSRKSQNLAKAIRQAQTYKYTDYYGYRY